MKSVAPAPSSAPSSLPKNAPKGLNPVARFLSHPLGPEFIVLALLVIAFIVGSLLSPFFLDFGYQLDATSVVIETGIIALAMTFIIVSGNIDLSVASTMALVSCATGVLYAKLGLSFELSLVAGLAFGAFLGLINGVLISWLKLPSLTVTLGTFALYRGLAQVLLGDESVSQFPDWFTGIDSRHIGNTAIPLPLVIFLALAVVFAFVLHRTVFGRWTVAIGTNEAASRYSGIAVDRIKILLFTLSGFMSGFAGLMMTSRLSAARYDMGRNLELDVITAVVLGGTSIFGGRGTILGTVIAFFLIGVLRTGMDLANIQVEYQFVVVGVLLLFSVVLPNLLQNRRI